MTNESPPGHRSVVDQFGRELMIYAYAASRQRPPEATQYVVSKRKHESSIFSPSKAAAMLNKVRSV